MAQAKKCVRCLQRSVIRPYYIICDDCGAKENVCCKCGLSPEAPIERPVPPVEEEREQVEFETDIKFLRERQRRKFYRLTKQGMSGEEALAKLNVSTNKSSNQDEDSHNGDDDDDDDESYSDDEDDDDDEEEEEKE